MVKQLEQLGKPVHLAISVLDMRLPMDLGLLMIGGWLLIAACLLLTGILLRYVLVVQ